MKFINELSIKYEQENELALIKKKSSCSIKELCILIMKANWKWFLLRKKDIQQKQSYKVPCAAVMLTCTMHMLSFSQNFKGLIFNVGLAKYVSISVSTSLVKPVGVWLVVLKLKRLFFFFFTPWSDGHVLWGYLKHLQYSLVVAL